ncbi:hypothetical protein [Nocardia sp. NPDC050435]|uniref:hypothetical protein n=1 Tax=Nocardia sp. NPDC050435 TaxID=3155040 RepID=UPI0033D2D3C2
MLIATIVISTIAFLRRLRNRSGGAAPRRTPGRFREIVRRPAPALAGLAALALFGTGGGVLLAC